MTLAPQNAIVQYLFEPADGGLDRVAILLANGIMERGTNVELWLGQQHGPTQHLIDPGLITRIIPTISYGRRGFRLFVQIPALARMIRQYKPVCILSAGNQSNLIIALARLLSGHRQTKIIQKITNPIARPGMTGFTRKLRQIRFFLTAKLSDLCLTLSPADAAEFIQHRPSLADTVKPVRNAYVTAEMLDAGAHRRSQQADALRSGPLRLLAVGRLATQKDYPTMLAALALLDQIDWHLTILGDGPLKNDIMALGQKLGISDRLTFLGFVDHPAPYFSRSDILLLSSRWEGLPAVIFEALASGCHIVATDCSPGLSQLLREAGSQPVALGDADGFAAAIAHTARNIDAPSRLHKVAARYSIAASVDDHLRLIDELLQAG